MLNWQRWCLSTIGFSSVLAGCVPDLSVEETARLATSEAPTVIAFLCPQDSVHVIRVSYTEPAIGVSKQLQFYNDLKKTDVWLAHNDQSALMLYDSIRHLFHIRADKFPIKAGLRYSLMVKMPSRDPVQASCKIPANTVAYQSVVWTKMGSVDSDGLPQYRFGWQDVPGEANYYAFWRLTVNYRSGQSEIQAEQAQFQVTDQGFENREILTEPVSLPSRVNLGKGNYERTEVLICNTDSVYYHYHKTLLQLRRDESPFTEPVRIASNVRGGYGIMAGYTRIKIIP